MHSTIETCVTFGEPVIINFFEDDFDPFIDPLIRKQKFRRGLNNFIKLGENEVIYNNDFRIFIRTNLSNPIIIPEVTNKVTA